MALIHVKVIDQLDHRGKREKIENNATFWTFAANEWHRLISPYTPMRTGNLYRNVTIEPKRITYNAPYANRIYFGTHFNFSKELHPLACAKWNEVAEPSQKPKLIGTLQIYIDSGRLDL